MDNKNKCKIIGIVLGLICFFYAPLCLAQSFETGKILDTIRCQIDTDLSYSLYLPSTYSPDTVHPVMYILDPGGRANYAVSLFEDDAEKYGYILVSSQEISNGSIQLMLKRAESLINDVEKRFMVDSERRYLAGFSGGSRMATTIASITKAFAGVLGCGAGQPNEKAHQSSAENNYMYVGFVGDEDYNYLEMQDQQTMLNGLGITNVLYIFEGAHRWPPRSQLHRAFEWLELQAVLSGLKDINMGYIDSIYYNHLYQLELLDMKNKQIELAQTYETTISLFSEWKDITELEDKRNKLMRSGIYQKDRKTSLDLREYEINMMELIDEILDRVFYFESLDKLDFDDWKSISRETNKETEILDLTFAFRRLQSYMYNLSAQLGEQKLEESKFKAARNLFKLQNEVYENDAFTYLLISKSYALEEKDKKALKNLKKAFEYGFNDIDYLQSDPDFDELRSSDKFQELINSQNQ